MLVQPIHELSAGENEGDISPPGDDNERLSKRDDDSSSNESRASSDDLPKNDVPELFSDEEDDSFDTREM